MIFEDNMADIKCKECNKKISDENALCPYCGKKMSPLKLTLVLIGVFIFMLLLSMMLPPDDVDVQIQVQKQN
jgi:hypothetical protein